MDLNPPSKIGSMKVGQLTLNGFQKKYPTLYRGEREGDVKRQEIFNFTVACAILCKVAQLILSGIVDLEQDSMLVTLCYSSLQSLPGMYKKSTLYPDQNGPAVSNDHKITFSLTIFIPTYIGCISHL